MNGVVNLEVGQFKALPSFWCRQDFGVSVTFRKNHKLSEPKLSDVRIALIDMDPAEYILGGVVAM